MGTDKNYAVSQQAALAVSIKNQKHYNTVVGSILDTLKKCVSGSIDILLKLIKIGIDLFSTINDSKIMDYVLLILFVGFIIFIVFYGLSQNKLKTKLSPNINSDHVKLPDLNFLNPMSFISKYIPTYKMKLFSYDLAPYSTTIDTSITDRPIISGRCDNLNKLEIGDSGVCLNTLEPVPIVWTLDIDKMNELNELSPSTKTLVDGGYEAQKYTVTIPWKIYEQDGLHYYPDCSAATFGNGDSASYLFTDNGTRTCEKVSIRRDINDSKIRPKYLSDNYTTLDGYSS